MSCKCSTNVVDCQPWPKIGRLSNRVRPRLPGFPNKPPIASAEARVFAYVLSTLDVDQTDQDKPIFCQRGCAPNFQGGYITLCTCMHYHRTWPSLAKEGVWVAGFCGKGCAGGNQLFYLMRVEKVIPNFADLWNSRKLPKAALRAKSSRFNIFGDVYEPKRRAALDPFAPKNYWKPMKNHKHLPDSWRKDICFGDKADPQPGLLVGHPDLSFVWKSPRYAYRGAKHPRFKFHDSLEAFYACLEEIK